MLRIYGYTDEPDQLALVMEFAAFGSLDKLLVVRVSLPDNSADNTSEILAACIL